MLNESIFWANSAKFGHKIISLILINNCCHGQSKDGLYSMSKTTQTATSHQMAIINVTLFHHHSPFHPILREEASKNLCHSNQHGQKILFSSVDTPLFQRTVAWWKTLSEDINKWNVLQNIWEDQRKIPIWLQSRIYWGVSTSVSLTVRPVWGLSARSETDLRAIRQYLQAKVRTQPTLSRSARGRTRRKWSMKSRVATQVHWRLHPWPPPDLQSRLSISDLFHSRVRTTMDKVPFLSH